jgi:GT2 family glycosyltransferase
MSNTPQVSLIIVSRDRPDDLKRVLASLRFQSYSTFEVVVVSNFDPCDDRVKYVEFDQANISAARNLGVDHAAGEIVAFCDDDAIPEPEWLTRLVPAFDEKGVGIAGGFVRGRNGISFQWKGLETDKFGSDHALEIEVPLTRGMVDGRMLKVQGTNCAFRKSALVEIGGFDEGFAFYLDETDVSWRLSQAGWETSVIPNAEVQHGFAASDLRGANRAPKSMYQIGASTRLFLKKHAGEGDISGAINVLKHSQRARLSRFLVWGQLEPRGALDLLNSLDVGLRSDCGSSYFAFGGTSEFLPFPTGETGRTLLYAGIWHIRGLMRQAKMLAKQGHQVTVFCFSRTSKFHNRYFDARGFWVQRGGIFGKSDRTRGYINPRMISINRRVAFERTALSAQRIFEDSEVSKLN